MAWIKIIQPEEATGELKREYDAAMERAGYIAQVLRIQSLNPKTLHTSIEMYKWIMKGPSGLSRAEREMLGTVVSRTNRCFY
jgi:uncharacterized peroxidase-related enzyme